MRRRRNSPHFWRPSKSGSRRRRRRRRRASRWPPPPPPEGRSSTTVIRWPQLAPPLPPPVKGAKTESGHRESEGGDLCRDHVEERPTISGQFTPCFPFHNCRRVRSGVPAPSPSSVQCWTAAARELANTYSEFYSRVVIRRRCRRYNVFMRI